MMTGVVTDRREAVIHLRLRGPAGQEQEIEAIIDTGFDGWLSLPSSLVARLGNIGAENPSDARSSSLPPSHSGKGAKARSSMRGVGQLSP